MIQRNEITEILENFMDTDVYVHEQDSSIIICDDIQIETSTVTVSILKSKLSKKQLDKISKYYVGNFEDPDSIILNADFLNYGTVSNTEIRDDDNLCLKNSKHKQIL